MKAKPDWLSFIEKEWTKRIVNNTKGRERWVEAQYRKVYPLPSCDANILMEDMFSEIRKGHEAAMEIIYAKKQLKEAGKT